MTNHDIHDHRMPPVLAARGLTSAHGGAPVFRGLDLTIAAGESVAVTGPSGSGKTTLLHSLCGLHEPVSGTVHYADRRSGWRDITAMTAEDRTVLRRTAFGMVFQSGQLLPELTAAENIAVPLLLGGAAPRTALAAAESMLHPLGLAGLGGRRPGELSGGQAQRVAIARALVTRPTVLFADEPTGALDSRTSEGVLDVMLRAARAGGTSLVVVTHDHDVAARCDRVVDLGRVMAR